MTLPPAVDEANLQRFLAERLGWDGSLAVEALGEGHSNLTYLIRCRDREVVLRRPPRGPLLPTAHDVLREYRVLAALADTAVPAPKPILACDDDRVIGAPFYLMEPLQGVVIRQELPPGFRDHPWAWAGIGERMIDVLAAIHALDWRALGLEGLGKPEGYLERQLRRWLGQMELARRRSIPELEEVGAWLQAHLPQSGPATIVHGDYKLDNFMFGAEPPARVVAVFDWEMSTLGDPLADLGWMLAFWREGGDPPPVLSIDSRVTELPGFRSRKELAERYGELTGRSLRDMTFYYVLAIWKMAVLLEGSYRRHLAGTTDDPLFAELERGVPGLARRARAACRPGGWALSE